MQQNYDIVALCTDSISLTGVGHDADRTLVGEVKDPLGNSILTFDETILASTDGSLGGSALPLDSQGEVLLGTYTIVYTIDGGDLLTSRFNIAVDLGLSISTEVKVGCVEVKATDNTNYTFETINRDFRLNGPSVGNELPQVVSSNSALSLALKPKWDNAEYVASLRVTGKVELLVTGGAVQAFSQRTSEVNSKVDVLVLSAKKIACASKCGDNSDLLAYLSAQYCGDYAKLSEIASKNGCNLSGPLLLVSDCDSPTLFDGQVSWQDLGDVSGTTKVFGKYKVYSDRVVINAEYVATTNMTSVTLMIQDNLVFGGLPLSSNNGFEFACYNANNVIVGKCYLQGDSVKVDIPSLQSTDKLKVQGVIYTA